MWRMPPQNERIDQKERGLSKIVVIIMSKNIQTKLFKYKEFLDYDI
jgi:hypothetical protein